MIRQSGHHQTLFDRELVAKNTEVAGWTQELDSLHDKLYVLYVNMYIIYIIM